MDEQVRISCELGNPVAHGGVTPDRHGVLVDVDPVSDGRLDRVVIDECCPHRPTVLHEDLGRLFDHLAPWFETKTGLQNSTVLQSLGDDEFAFVNHARWDSGVLSVAAHQFLRPSFHRFVRPTLAANNVHVYPALYRRL